jgi:hypothetical protein
MGSKESVEKRFEKWESFGSSGHSSAILFSRAAMDESSPYWDSYLWKYL